MAGPEKRTESISQGPRPKPKTPRARTAPTTPERAREGVARVRDDAEATFREVDYYTKVSIGAIPQEFMRVHKDALLRLRKTPKKGSRFDRDYLAPLHERVRASRKKKKPLREAIAKGLDDNRRLFHARETEAMFVATGLSVNAGDTQTIIEAQRKFREIIPDDLPREREKQLQIAQNVIQQFGSSADPEYVRTVIVDLGAQEDEVELYERALQEEQVAQALAEQSVATDDPEKAFAEALKKGSPELQKAYEEYVAFWNSESVADVVTPLMPEIPGTTKPSESDIAGAVNAFTGTKVKLDFVGTNYGNVSFGKIRKSALLLTVNDELKLYILDPNADRGRRGPINLNPAEVRAELAHSLIDDEFSKQFRHFVGRGTEVDPQEIADAKLFKIVHAFLPPGSDEHMDRLDATQKSIIINLAILFATPDKKYISLQDKARFLNNLKPDRLAIAKKKLHEQDFPEKFSLSAFDSSFASS